MRPVDSSTLATFRFFFGMIMIWSALRYYFKGRVDTYYIKRKFFFTYDWFSWISLWPSDGIYYHFAIMIVSALFLALGFFYRLSAVVFFLTYTYTFLLGKSVYNNHYYFICLIGFLFCIVSANRSMSIDAYWKRKIKPESISNTVPFWNVLVIKLQIFIVYFYGGVAKVNLDWLRGEPMRHWLMERAYREGNPDIVSKFMESETATYFFSYGGLIFDFAIGFLLICRKTRLLAICLVLIFNLTNNWLFTIGIFPFLMIAATVIFLEPDTPRNFIHKYFPRFNQNKTTIDPRPSHYRKPAMIFFSFYLIIQALLPFRHWLYEGNVSWTEEGRYFSWHMKLRDKSICKIKFLATDLDSKDTWFIPAKKYLTQRQYFSMCKNPQMILQYAHFLGTKLDEAGINNPKIYARSTVSLNFREPQPLIDPDVDLLKESYSTFQHEDWIVPLKN
ncbi:MAG: HTTM domain-containing protein [Nitrospinales bacterium]